MDLPSWTELEVEAMRILALIERFTLPQSVVLTGMIASAFVYFVSIRFLNKNSILLSLLFAILTVIGLSLEAANLFQLYHHFSSLEQFVSLNLVNPPSAINFINTVGTCALIVIWMIQESIYHEWELARAVAYLIGFFISPLHGLAVFMRHRLHLLPFFRHKKAYRFSHLYFLVAGTCFALVLPKWMALSEQFSVKKPQAFEFYKPSVSNFANMITSRTLLTLYIPIVAWSSGHSHWHMIPFIGFSVLGVVSLPSVLASFLVYREFTSRKIPPKSEQINHVNKPIPSTNGQKQNENQKDNSQKTEQTSANSSAPSSSKPNKRKR